MGVDNVQYFSHIWKEEGCSPPSLKEGILPMARDHKQKEDYMNKNISKPEEREARSEVRAGLIRIDEGEVHAQVVSRIFRTFIER